MLTAVRCIFGRIVHLQTALRCQWDKCRKNNLLLVSPSIRCTTLYLSYAFFAYELEYIPTSQSHFP